MTKAEIQNIPIKKLLSEYGFALRANDINYIVKQKIPNRNEIIETISKQHDDLNGQELADEMVKTMKQNAGIIDKTALLVVMLKNYTDELLKYDTKIKENNEFMISQIKKSITKLKKGLSGIDKKVYYLLRKEDGTVFIKTVSAQSLLGEKQKKTNQNIEKLEELEKDITLTEVLNPIVLTDFGDVICEDNLGEQIRTALLYNIAMKNKIDVNKTEKDEMIKEIKEKVNFSSILSEVEKMVRDNITNIDIDKLVLCSAYRYIDNLEEELVLNKEKNSAIIIERLKKLEDYLKGKNVKIAGRVEKMRLTDGEMSEEQISYKVKDLSKDLEKIDGNTYWGKAKISQVKKELEQGKISLQDISIERLNLSKEEIRDLAIISNQNYVKKIKNGLIKPEDIKEINSQKTNLSSESISMLIEQKFLNEQELLDLYMQGKIEIADAVNANINVKEEITAEMLYKEYKAKDNDERKSRIKNLYEKLFLEGKTKEELEENKGNAIDEYLQTMNTEYLEMFVTLETLKIEDLDGILLGQEWIKALEKSEISEQFFIELQEHNLIENEVITGNDEIIAMQMKLWEEGKISSEQIKKLNIDFYEILKMYDEGIIKGKRIGDLISKDDFRKYRDQISSNYAYGMYDTIRPLFVAYNSKILNADRTIKIIEEMKVSSEEVASFCREGLLTGERIAELRYKGILKKKQFRELKEEGLVSDEEEIAVANNLTPQEMLKELEANGCTKIEQIEEILGKLDFMRIQAKRERKDNPKSYNKKILNPIKRNELLALLGTDTIVTNSEKGFNGYQVFLIPNLGVAVLEKMFRKDRYDEIKPSYGDATYICEIGKYIQVSGQSKKEIRDFMNVEGSSNGNVSIINHSSQWGKKLIEEIQKVNSKIEIEKENGSITAIRNNGADLDIDIKELNGVINQIAQKEASISLEEYE